MSRVFREFSRQAGTGEIYSCSRWVLSERDLEAIGIMKMPTSADLVAIDLCRELDGYFVATSSELPGLVLTHTSVSALSADIPAAIKALYQANLGLSVEVVEAYPASAKDVNALPAWMVMREPLATPLD